MKTENNYFSPNYLLYILLLFSFFFHFLIFFFKSSHTKKIDQEEFIEISLLSIPSQNSFSNTSSNAIPSSQNLKEKRITSISKPSKSKVIIPTPSNVNIRPTNISIHQKTQTLENKNKPSVSTKTDTNTNVSSFVQENQTEIFSNKKISSESLVQKDVIQPTLKQSSINQVPNLKKENFLNTTNPSSSKIEKKINKKESLVLKKTNQPIQIEGEVKTRKIIFTPIPPKISLKYPLRMSFEFTILPNGIVDQIYPLTKGKPEFEELCIQTLQQYRFEPLIENKIQKGIIHFILKR